MKIAMIQIRVSENSDDNLRQVLQGLDRAADADLAILPELWNTPFENEAILRHADESARLLEAVRKKAAQHHLWIISGTLPCKEEGKLYNRTFVFNDKGETVTHCDKLHLLEVHTRSHDYREADVFTPGSHLCRVQTPWGKIGICICMDVRFGELCRLLCEDCFLLAVCAGFNARVGEKHWKALIQARSIENEVFTAAVNPAPVQYAGYASYGHSMLVDPDGLLLEEMRDDQMVSLTEIDPEKSAAIRARSPFWRLRRLDLYTLKENDNEKNSV